MEDFDDFFDSKDVKINHSTINVRNYFNIPKSKFKATEITQFKENLVVYPTTCIYGTDILKEPILCYKEDDDYLSVPLSFGFEVFGKTDIPLVDARFDPIYSGDIPVCQKDLIAKIQQDEAHDYCINKLVSNGQALLEFPTGEGKTAIAMNIWATMCQKAGRRLKVLWIANQGPFLDQVEERIKQYFDETVQIANIGGKENTKRKSLKKKFIDGVYYYDFVLMTIQDLVGYKKMPDGSMVRKYGPEFFQNFNMTMIDEAHHYIQAKTYKEIFQMVNTRYIFAFSASISEKDEKEYIFHWLGSPYSKLKDYTNLLDIHCYETANNPVTEEKKLIISKNPGEKKYEPDIMKMWSNQSFDEKRNLFMAEKLLEIEKTLPPKGQILCLSQRCEKYPHLSIMNTLLKKLDSTIKTCEYYGNSKNSEELKDARIILSSFDTFAESLDVPNICVVVWLQSPKNQTQRTQSIGRGIRINSMFNKLKVVAFFDCYSIFYKKWFAQLRFLQNTGNDVNVYKLGKPVYVVKTDLKKVEKQQADKRQKNTFIPPTLSTITSPSTSSKYKKKKYTSKEEWMLQQQAEKETIVDM